MNVGIFRSGKKREGFWGWVAIILSVIGLLGFVLGFAALFFVSAGGIPKYGIATPSSAEGLAEAKLYLEAKDYAKALPLLKKAADAGNAYATNNLGWLYENGLGVAQDYAKAREWYQKGADAGDAHAKDALSRLRTK